MENPLKEHEIVTMHQLSELALSLTNRISYLRKTQRELISSYNRVGLSFEYGQEQDVFNTPTIDVTIDLGMGSNPNPLKAAWTAFLETANDEIEKEIIEKMNSLKEIKNHFKKM
jgi:hypothetical protein